MPPMKAETGLEVMEDAKEELAKPVKDGDEISLIDGATRECCQ